MQPDAVEVAHIAEVDDVRSVQLGQQLRSGTKVFRRLGQDEARMLAWVMLGHDRYQSLRRHRRYRECQAN